MSLHACPVCGNATSVTTVQTHDELRLGGRTGVVPVERQLCDECGESFVTPAQMRSAQQALVDLFRRQDDLLAPGAIKALRAKFGLTQAQLEIVLGVAPKTVVRWERGTVCQSRAVDQLLRTAEAVPGALEFLAHRAGVQVAAPSISARPARSGTVIPFPAPRATQTFALDELREMPTISNEALK